MGGKKPASTGKPKSKAAPSSPGEGQAPCAEALIVRGESLLDTGEEPDLREALTCFDEALAIVPSKQSAWYHRGVAASELSEELPLGLEKSGLLLKAWASFRQVFVLDTSKRGETRYLAAIGLGRLLVQASSSTEDAVENGHSGDVFDMTALNGLCPGGSPPQTIPQALAQACEAFVEAQRLHDEWGHDALAAEALGGWGEALSHMMRIEISSSAQGLASGLVDGPLVDSIMSLCAAASAKFEFAVQAQITDPEDDMRWITVHAEHLISFVDFITKAATQPGQAQGHELSLQWLYRGTEAWKEAARLSEAALQLNGPGVGWEAHALQGDVFAAAGSLLNALPQGSASHLRMPVPEGAAATMDVDVEGESAEEVLASHSEMASAMAAGAIDASACLRHAEGAYRRALAAGGADAAASVGCSLGEFFLDTARRHQGTDDAAELLRRAGEAFQSVVALKGDAKGDVTIIATCWYNLACVAAILGKSDQALLALERCIKKVGAERAAKWEADAQQDPDLAAVCRSATLSRQA